MAAKTITALPAASALTAADLMEIEQAASGKVTLDILRAFINQTDVIVAASAGINSTQTVVKSITIPANTLKVGSTYRITASGVCTSSAANASNFRIRIGTTTLTGVIAAVATPTAAASGTNVPFSINFLVTVRSIGASGTAIGSTVLLNNGVTGVSAAAVVVDQVTTAVTINTTVALLFELTYQAAAATTTCTFHNASIEQIQA